MRLKSALEDFSSSTLQAIGGLWARLQYMAGLQSPKGGYAHWGLSRTYGNEAAQQACSEAHRGVVATILRTPLKDLVEEVDRSCGRQGVAPEKYLEQLNDSSGKLLPQHPAAGSFRHLNSVLSALLRLEKRRRAANPRGA